MKDTNAQDLIAGLAWDADNNGCWGWPGGLNRNGQPILSIDGDGVLAHREAYRLWRESGYRLQGPLRVVLLQTCGNRRCCSPFHMEPLDPRNGSTARDPRGVVNRSKTRCRHGHSFSDSNLHVRPCGRRRCLACHREELRWYRMRRKERYLQAQRRFLEMQPKDWFDELPELEPVELTQLPVTRIVQIA